MPEVAEYSPAEKVQEYNILRSQLAQDRSSFEAHWRELGNYIKPRRTRWFTNDKNRGDKRNQYIMDSTATFSCETLRSGMHAGMTSPARPWLRLTVPDPDLAENPDVKDWLHTVTDRMLVMFQRSNVYNVLPTVYGDTGTFGTGAMGVMEDDEDLFRCYSYPIGSYYLGINARGLVDTFIYDFTMTVRQIVTKYGGGNPRKPDFTNISQTVKDLWEKKNYNATVDVCWVICPNEDYDPRRLESKYMKFSSCHFERGSQTTSPGAGTTSNANTKLLKESGFNEFPILAPRWEVTGEDTYGTECPGMMTLPDIKQLQIGERRSLQGIEKMVNPPLQGPSELRNQKVSALPGEFSYVNVSQGQKGITTLYDVNFAVDKMEQKQEQVRNRIRQGWFTNLFLMMASDDRSGITATEINERHEEKMLQLGPLVERTNDELLGPLVFRVFAIMDRAGLIPQRPDSMKSMPLKVEYISLMAQAQKLVSVGGLERFMQDSAGILQVFPEGHFKIKVNSALDDLADTLGINPNVLRTDEEADAMLQQSQKAAQDAQAAKNVQATTQAAKNLSQSDMTGQNALTEMINNARGS